MKGFARVILIAAPLRVTCFPPHTRVPCPKVALLLGQLPSHRANAERTKEFLGQVCLSHRPFISSHTSRSHTLFSSHTHFTSSHVSIH